MFVGEFMDLVSTAIPEHANNIYIGEFNLHISNRSDTDSAIFSDATDAMGLYQHVAFPTHSSCNILDLILSNIGQDTTVLTTAPGQYITDHKAIISTLNLKKLRSIHGKSKFRQFSKITPEQLIKKFKPDNIELSDKLDTVVMGLNQEPIRVVDTLAPAKTCNINFRVKKLWYDQGIKNHKRLMCKLEKKWLKYKLDSCWTAYKKCRNSYYGKLNANQNNALKEKFADCSHDTKNLLAVVSNRTTKWSVLQWPPHKSDSELTDEFADFFQAKIAKIREALINKPRFTPQPSDAPRFKSFAPMIEQQVLKAIKCLKSKACE